MDNDDLYWQRMAHNMWMKDNDPNTWAWLLPRTVRLEHYSRAIREANRMRKSAFAKWTVNGDSTLATRIDKWDLLKFVPEGR